MRQLQQGLGALFVGGWTLDDVLDLTWEQLEVVSTCVAEYRALQLNTVVELVAGALGGKVDKKAARKRNRSQKADRPGSTAADKFAAIGVQVHPG